MSSLANYRMRIGGDWREARSGASFESVDPYSGKPWATVPEAGPADVDDAVRAARDALHGPWGSASGFERARLMRQLADLIDADAARLAAIETRDNGKLLREMRGQVDVLSGWLRYYAGAADKLEGRVIPTDGTNYLVYTRREPVGVVAAIVPWNSPLLLSVWKLAPALAAGCTMVLKPSDSTPVSALELAVLAEKAGLPPGVLSVLTGSRPELGQALVEHPQVDKVAFTGSTAVGVAVAQSAAAHLAPALLELGGKSAQIVFDDADIPAAANGVVAGVFAAAGQTCLAGSRLIVHESVHDALIERLAARARSIVLGDPTDAATEMGPLANERQHAAVTGLVERALAGGASALAGRTGPVDGLGGLFINPTILTGVTPDMEVWREEVFGPVLAVATFATEDEAVELANATRYGLAGGVWTRDVRRAHRVAHALRAGTVWVNAYRVVAPSVPFGGVGRSGWGRENGAEGLDGYLTTKAVWVELSGATRDPFTLG